jgi:hypothetical protein
MKYSIDAAIKLIICRVRMALFFFQMRSNSQLGYVDVKDIGFETLSRNVVSASMLN